MKPSPKIEVFSHSNQFDDAEIKKLIEVVNAALPIVLAQPGSITDYVVLPDLEEVEVSLITDETIASVHEQFMDDPSATDVITFQHGEILVSTDTAARVSIELGQQPLRETTLYVIHGLLHLFGYDDLSEPARTIMHRRQEEILAQVWPLLDGAVS